MFKAILSFLTNPFADLVGGWNARKTIAAETAAETAKLEGQLKATALQAQIDRIKSQDSADAAYDNQVLLNRRMSIMDELLILFWLVVFSLHFIPDYAAKMKAGWLAIGEAPWWFQFGMLGILVSTLGLMRLFRMWTERKFSLGRAS